MYLRIIRNLQLYNWKICDKVGNNAFKGRKKLKTVKFAKGILAKTKKSLKSR